MKKVLIFQMSGIAYDSTRFFSSCLGKALENAGIEVTWFDFQRQTMKEQSVAGARKRPGFMRTVF